MSVEFTCAEDPSLAALSPTCRAQDFTTVGLSELVLSSSILDLLHLTGH
jgi:hypothetical protein